jgi:hypothetical protein
MVRLRPDLMQIDDGGGNAAAAATVASTTDPRIALRKLQSNQPLTEDEKSSLGLPATKKSTDTASTADNNKPKWVKASTVNTADGPVDVDANGLAQDGSKPVAATTKKSNKVPAGFTEGAFPKELEQFFGSASGYLGYKIETVTDKNGRTYNQLSVATGPNSSQTFGAGFTKDASGKYVTYSPESGDEDTGDGNGNGNKVYVASDGKEFTDQQAYVDYEISLREAGFQTKLIADQNKAERKSAYDLLYSEFKQYGLEALVSPLKSLIEEGVSPSEFTLRLRETDAYKKRFAANAQRVAKGLRALSEAEYIGTEDQYQDVMRRYGMPESYYTKGELGIQSGFEKFLAGDVSAVELEDRIQTAQNRVVNSNPEVAKALKEFYPGISNGDILAYVLDPTNAIEQIKRKVTAAEIGGAAIQSGLQTGMTRAEELAAAGITKQQAQAGFQTVAEVAPRGGQLAEIYKQSPYTQTTAEQEVFGLAGSVDAAKQRKKLTSLETAAFSGSAGSGAIARERAGSF